MAEEKIKKIREELGKCITEIMAEQDEVQKLGNLPEWEKITLILASSMKTDDIFRHISRMGIEATKIKGVSPESIINATQEFIDASKGMRRAIANGDVKESLFQISQFQLFQRKILREVGYILSSESICELSKKVIVPPSKTVFIVHGRDDKPKLELARMLEKMGLRVIILSEQADKGRTIIEKLEGESLEVSYAFIILTPDDLGCLDKTIGKSLDELTGNKENNEELNKILGYLSPRARQNIILELGYFIGKLGRNRVCCLYKGNVELPSDVHGIAFKKFNDSVEECYKGIIDELRAAGFNTS